MPSKNEKVNSAMQILLTLVFVASGLLVLFAPNFLIQEALPEATQKFAAGWLGFILGYWLS